MVGICKNYSYPTTSKTVNTSYLEASELLQRARNNISNVTSKDVVRPPSAKPRLLQTPRYVEKNEQERPSTVHVSNVHQHLRRAHKVRSTLNCFGTE